MYDEGGKRTVDLPRPMTPMTLSDLSVSSQTDDKRWGYRQWSDTQAREANKGTRRRTHAIATSGKSEPCRGHVSTYHFHSWISRNEMLRLGALLLPLAEECADPHAGPGWGPTSGYIGGRDEAVSASIHQDPCTIRSGADSRRRIFLQLFLRFT